MSSMYINAPCELRPAFFFFFFGGTRASGDEVSGRQGMYVCAQVVHTQVYTTHGQANESGYTFRSIETGAGVAGVQAAATPARPYARRARVLPMSEPNG